MKKFLLSVAMCFCAVFAANAEVEAGDMAVGANLGVAPVLEDGQTSTNFGLGVKYQYCLSSKIRLEADMEYWFKDKGWSVFDISANAHYLFDITDKITVYPLAGLGFAHVGGASFLIPTGFDAAGNEIYTKVTNSFDRLLINIGAGAQYQLTDKIAVGFELKYQYINDYSRFPIQLGFAYKF